jgi:hypothetical protein
MKHSRGIAVAYAANFQLVECQATCQSADPRVSFTLLQVEKYQKCGGSGGNNAVDAGACCTSGFYCARINQWHWQCEAGAANTPVPSNEVTLIIDGKTYPACSNPAAAGSPDAASRRWGWENGKTCVVPPPGVLPVGATPSANTTAPTTGCKYTVSQDKNVAMKALW